MGYSIKTIDCNGSCGSCYENRIREGRGSFGYDIQKIRKRIGKIIEESDPEERGRPPSFHGGEPLLMKKEDFEILARQIFRYWGENSIQTNGILIDKEWIDLFKRYNFSIGVSIDGDTAELNRGRWNGGDISDTEIQYFTDQVLENMKSCVDAGLSVSVISLLRFNNTGEDRVYEFIKFIKRLKSEFGVWSMRANPVIVYDQKFRGEELRAKELGMAWMKLADFVFQDPDFQLYPIRDFVDGVMGYVNNLTCSFKECDCFATSAEIPIGGEGSLGNCLHGGMATEGIIGLRSGSDNGIRYQILQEVNQEDGGCKGCRYWFICKGGCPGAGLDNDWRNRSRFCIGIKDIYFHLGEKLVGIMSNFIPAYEFYPEPPSRDRCLWDLTRGSSSHQLNSRTKVREVISQSMVKKAGSGNKPHGDKPHGDHTDADRSRNRRRS